MQPRGAWTKISGRRHLFPRGQRPPRELQRPAVFGAVGSPNRRASGATGLGLERTGAQRRQDRRRREGEAHGSLAPQRFPRALHMDGEYSALLLARLPPRPPFYPADYYPFPDGSAGDPPPVTDLLVLERGADAASPLTQAEAAHHLLRAVIKSPGFDYGRALADMIRLAARCKSHLLRSSTPEAAGETALALLTAV